MLLRRLVGLWFIDPHPGILRVTGIRHLVTRAASSVVPGLPLALLGMSHCARPHVVIDLLVRRCSGHISSVMSEDELSEPERWCRPQ